MVTMVMQMMTVMMTIGRVSVMMVGMLMMSVDGDDDVDCDGCFNGGDDDGGGDEAMPLLCLVAASMRRRRRCATARLGRRTALTLPPGAPLSLAWPARRSSQEGLTVPPNRAQAEEHRVVMRSCSLYL